MKRLAATFFITFTSMNIYLKHLITGLIFCAIGVITNSCSCDWHLNKAKYKCGFSFKSDTIYKKDSVFINSVKKDTVFNYFQRDTVIVREGRLTMKYFYNNHDSTVYLSGKCDTIKIEKEVPVIVNNTEIKESYTAYFKWTAIILICLVGGAYLIKFK